MDPDHFQNLTKTSLCKDTSAKKNFHENPITVSGDISQIVEDVLSRNGEESFKKFMNPDPEADDFRNLISSSLCIDTSVVKFS